MKSMPAVKLRSRNSDGRTKGSLRGEGVDEEQVEGRGGDDRLDDDLAGAEPVELLAAVEQDLHGADRQAQGAEAEPIELRAGIASASPAERSIMPRKARMPIGRLM